jgi:hypothetical protein
MPHSCVAAHQLVVRLGPVDEIIGSSKIEAASGRLCRVLFHAVEGKQFNRISIDRSEARVAVVQTSIVVRNKEA